MPPRQRDIPELTGAPRRPQYPAPPFPPGRGAPEPLLVSVNALRQGLSPFALALALSQTRPAVAQSSWSIPALRIAADQIELAVRLGLATRWVPLGSRAAPEGLEHGRPGLPDWGLSDLHALPEPLRGLVARRLESPWGSWHGQAHRTPAHPMLARIRAQGGPSNAAQAALITAIAQGFIDGETASTGEAVSPRGKAAGLTQWLRSRFGRNGLGLDFGWTGADGCRLIDGDGPLVLPRGVASDVASWRIENRAWLLR